MCFFFVVFQTNIYCIQFRVFFSLSLWTEPTSNELAFPTAGIHSVLLFVLLWFSIYLALLLTHICVQGVFCAKCARPLFTLVSFFFASFCVNFFGEFFIQKRFFSVCDNSCNFAKQTDDKKKHKTKPNLTEIKSLGCDLFFFPWTLLIHGTRFFRTKKNSSSSIWFKTHNWYANKINAIFYGVSDEIRPRRFAHDR